MCPSTDTFGAHSEFAAVVLRGLLRRIEDENSSGNQPILVSHAWTDGPIMYLVYAAPPTDITRGLVRDTRESLIDPAPWQDVADAVTYYYLLDIDERQPWGSFRQPGEPDTILWSGDRQAGLPERPSDIPETYRYTPPPEASSAKSRPKQGPPVINEPRRYADPL